MPRATRMPLGHAAKIWVVASTRDVDGNVVEEGETGWYYMWWRGIHCLMGREGQAAGLFTIRPSFEEFKCEGFSFKIDYKAEVQLPAGDPEDPTDFSGSSKRGKAAKTSKDIKTPKAAKIKSAKSNLGLVEAANKSAKKAAKGRKR